MAFYFLTRKAKQSFEQVIAVGGKFTRSVGPWAVDFEPAICNGHLPYPWGQVGGRGGWGDRRRSGGL